MIYIFLFKIKALFLIVKYSHMQMSFDLHKVIIMLFIRTG